MGFGSSGGLRSWGGSTRGGDVVMTTTLLVDVSDTEHMLGVLLELGV